MLNSSSQSFSPAVSRSQKPEASTARLSDSRLIQKQRNEEFLKYLHGYSRFKLLETVETVRRKCCVWNFEFWVLGIDLASDSA